MSETPLMTDRQFCCCIWRSADIGVPIIVAYDVLVHGAGFMEAIDHRCIGGISSAYKHLLLRTMNTIRQRHADRLHAYANWSGDPKRMTPDQWMCSAIRPAKWTDHAFAVRDYLVNGAPHYQGLLSGSGYTRIIRRHICNLLAYTDFKPQEPA